MIMDSWENGQHKEIWVDSKKQKMMWNEQCVG